MLSKRRRATFSALLLLHYHQLPLTAGNSAPPSGGASFGLSCLISGRGHLPRLAVYSGEEDVNFSARGTTANSEEAEVCNILASSSDNGWNLLLFDFFGLLADKKLPTVTSWRGGAHCKAKTGIGFLLCTMATGARSTAFTGRLLRSGQLRAS